jgi:tetratricopeptide (TPR) repeat protein
MHLESGVELNLSRAHYFLGSIHLDLGDLKNAQRYAEEALRLSRKNNEKDTEGISLISLGRILGKTGRSNVDKAEECILKGMEILHELKIKPYYSLGHLFLGELFMSTDDQEKAILNLKKASKMFREMGMDYWLNLTQKFLKGR